MRKIFFLILLFSFTTLKGQTPQKLNSAEIYEAINKLNFLGSVLYVAAHPDDENTRLISYFANDVNARTGYLSITRGDGGQNLIGPELKEKLGLIRTQELLAARRIDGGQQLFTRANDFGYTKTPEEALEFWGKEEVLQDVVWAIRKFKPDVVVNRFNHRTSGETHGQHTASALLSVDAFELAGDASVYKDQLSYVEPHQPKRLFFNTSPWFYGSDEEFEKADKTNFLEFETGVYFPTKGLSNPEIAALSRSQHQSQGFGSTGSRGSQIEYLELIKGNLPENASGVFAGIDTSWSRIKGGAEIGKILSDVEKNYDFTNPSASVPALIEAYQLIQKLEDKHWRTIKSEQIKNIIAASSGLFLEAVARSSSATPKESVEIVLEAINRSNGKMVLSSVSLDPSTTALEQNITLSNNEGWKKPVNYTIPADADYTTPYWLEEDGTIGLYKVNDPELIGLPETPTSLNVTFNVMFNGYTIPFTKPVVHKFNDPVKGEVYQPFEIIPPVSVKIEDNVVLFPDATSKKLPVTLKSGKSNISGTIKLKASPGWKIIPETANFSIKEKGATTSVIFEVTPPKEQNESTITPVVNVEGKEYVEEVTSIDYPHIPRQNLVLSSEAKLVKLNIQKKGENIAYIEGAGDVVPESMQQIGYNITKIDPQQITAASLAKYDAVILGIRAYNTVEELKYKQAALLKYVENGGTVIVQYNTNRGLLVNPIAPYDLQISRDRVTEEDAQVNFINPQHPLLNSPNKISEKDFNGWVQERGLYFADKWGPEFTPVLSMKDQNEPESTGSLLVARYGKGYFIYTGLSFFRQFPEGVPGAFKLFANMVSIGK